MPTETRLMYQLAILEEESGYVNDLFRSLLNFIERTVVRQTADFTATIWHGSPTGSRRQISLVQGLDAQASFAAIESIANTCARISDEFIVPFTFIYDQDNPSSKYERVELDIKALVGATREELELNMAGVMLDTEQQLMGNEKILGSGAADCTFDAASAVQNLAREVADRPGSVTVWQNTSWYNGLALVPLIILTLSDLLEIASGLALQTVTEEVPQFDRLALYNLRRYISIGSSKLSEIGEITAAICQVAHEIAKPDGHVATVMRLLCDVEKARHLLLPKLDEIDNAVSSCSSKMESVRRDLDSWSDLIQELQGAVIDVRGTLQSFLCHI